MRFSKDQSEKVRGQIIQAVDRALAKGNIPVVFVAAAPDGSFQVEGDTTLTRYDQVQILARALALVQSAGGSQSPIELSSKIPTLPS
jgi:hypothetical protein